MTLALVSSLVLIVVITVLALIQDRHNITSTKEKLELVMVYNAVVQSIFWMGLLILMGIHALISL